MASSLYCVVCVFLCLVSVPPCLSGIVEDKLDQLSRELSGITDRLQTVEQQVSVETKQVIQDIYAKLDILEADKTPNGTAKEETGKLSWAQRTWKGVTNAFKSVATRMGKQKSNNSTLNHRKKTTPFSKHKPKAAKQKKGKKNDTKKSGKGVTSLWGRKRGKTSKKKNAKKMHSHLGHSKQSNRFAIHKPNIRVMPSPDKIEQGMERILSGNNIMGAVDKEILQNECGQPPQKPNTTVNVDVKASKVIATYQCKKGFANIGPPSECTGNKTWTEVKVTCTNFSDCTYKIGRRSHYNGTVSKTHSNKTCQKWTDTKPHYHFYQDVSFSDTTGLGPETKKQASNYCRDPGHLSIVGTPWCFTTDDDKRWEKCDIPQCPL